MLEPSVPGGTEMILKSSLVKSVAAQTFSVELKFVAFNQRLIHCIDKRLI